MKFRQLPVMKEATFDLTPMIDVVLLLIIFFMLSSQFARVQAKELDLPREAGEEVPAEAPTEIIIDIDGKGVVWIDDREIPDADLEAAIRGTVRSSDNEAAVEILVRADREAGADRLNQVALTLMRLNVRSWRIGAAGGAAESGGAR
jgi:biopolymer transport protein ExbD